MADDVAVSARPSSYLIGAVIGAAVLIAFSPVLGLTPLVLVVLLPAAMVAMVYLVRRPHWTVVAMVVCEVANISGVVGARGPISLFRISLLLGLVALGIALFDPVARSRLNRWTLVFIGLVGTFLTTQFVASIGAQDVAAAFSLMTKQGTDFVFIVVVMILIQVTQRRWTVAAAVVIPLATIGVLTLLNQVIFNGAMSFGGFATVTEAKGELVTTLRFGGPLPDSNFWGRHLIMGLPLAGALMVRASRAGRGRAVIGWAAALLGLLVGIYLTQSRGTFIATLVVLTVWTLASGPSAWRVAVRMLPAVVLLLLVPGIGNRLIALVVDVWGSRPSYSIDLSVASRMAAGEVAWTMFDDRPVFGFGPGGFELEVARYSGLVPTAVINPATTAPHNLYAQLASESGVVGLIGWAVLVIGVTGCVAIRVTQLALRSDVVERSLAAAAMAAVVGWSVASIFIHLSYLRTFGILLALAGAIATDIGTQWREPLRECTRTAAQASAAALVGLVVVAGCLTATATRTHTASQRVTVLPTGATEYAYAYALDVRSYDVVLPTYAAMMTSGTPGVAAVADTVRGIVTITATSPDPQAARGSLRLAVERARTNLAMFNVASLYDLRPVGSTIQRDETKHSAAATVSAFAAGAVVAVGAYLLLRRRMRKN
ncbi:O-antigen ligase family protein [Mycobacterium neglectum]|uniref:O-antigen ligase family protein n=1 Tax=Mycobacterium neglectum TaxID=242737 RepID=UPI0011452181|nr:O-antigen ligase family protein [Mycobacterium neglectum]